MSWYGWLMTIGIPVVVLGWAGYFLWDYKMRQEEAKQPKVRSERHDKNKSEVSEWAKKMAEFKSPVPKRPAGGEGA